MLRSEVKAISLPTVYPQLAQRGLFVQNFAWVKTSPREGGHLPRIAQPMTFNPSDKSRPKACRTAGVSQACWGHGIALVLS